MTIQGRTYQRRHLRAPLKNSLIFADGQDVLRARMLNISGGGILLHEIPHFPSQDEVPVLFSLPNFPSLRNFSLLKLHTFSAELFPAHVLRAKVMMVRREELAQNISNIFNVRVGLKFSRLSPQDQNAIEEYVKIFSGNLIYLQTLIDSYSVDEETKSKVKALASLLGYRRTERIAELRAEVTQDYRNLVWL